MYFIPLLKKFCHRPSDKKQNKTKTEADKLTNKALSSCLQTSKRLSKEEKKMSAFQHQILPSDDNLYLHSKI